VIGRAVVSVVAAVLLVSPSAVAHSLLLESSPAAEATLAAPPPRLTLRFNNRIEKALSRITLVDDRGTLRALAITVADDGADRLSAAVPPLTPGAYRVEWQVLSTDGHVVSGGFGFRLAR
jgi:copper resistance protein C